MNAFPTDICLSISSSSTSILSWAGGEPNPCTGIASSASSASATFARAGPAAGAVRSWRKETNINAKLVINSRYEEIEHTYLLTSSPSEINILFVLEEFPSHALDCGVPPSCARTNEVGEVFLSDLEQVVRILVPVIDDVVVNKISQGVFLLNTPATRGSVG